MTSLTHPRHAEPFDYAQDRLVSASMAKLDANARVAECAAESRASAALKQVEGDAEGRHA